MGVLEDVLGAAGDGPGSELGDELSRERFKRSRALRGRTRWNYAITLYQDSTATLDDLREAVTTLEAMERFVPRVFGGTHPIAVGIERSLRNAQTVLSAREAGEDVVWVKP